MILPAQTLDKIRPIAPWHPRTKIFGLTFGLGPAGYDVRVAEDLVLWPVIGFRRASTFEHFDMPADLIGYVKDKSTWARRGLFVQNTVIEPGWRGYLTLEITNQSWQFQRLCAGMPIAQIVFHRLEEATVLPYPETGKYQDQPAGAQPAKVD